MPPQNKKAVQDKEDEESSQSSDLNRDKRSSKSGATNPYSAADANGKAPNRFERQEFPNGQKTTIDYSKSQVNIAQILTCLLYTSPSPRD